VVPDLPDEAEPSDDEPDGTTAQEHQNGEDDQGDLADEDWRPDGARAALAHNSRSVTVVVVPLHRESEAPPFVCLLYAGSSP
jgi:hypothetical protein